MPANHGLWRENPLWGAPRIYSELLMLYGLVILRHARRRMVTIGVTTNPTAEHLRRLLKAYASYYNELRTHLSLNKDAPRFTPSTTAERSTMRPVGAKASPTF